MEKEKISRLTIEEIKTLKVSEMTLIHGIGLRTIKTCISVMICVSITTIIANAVGDGMTLATTTYFGAIAAIVCMQDTVDSSIKAGFDRCIGTLIGSCVGIIMIALSFFDINNFMTVLMYGFGVFFAIYFSMVIDRKNASSNACISFLSVFNTTAFPYQYALIRIVENFFGIFVAVMVNRYFNPKCLMKKTGYMFYI